MKKEECSPFFRRPDGNGVHELEKEFKQTRIVSDWATRLGIRITYAKWQVANDRVIFFAECTRQPLQITLNDAVIERLAALPVAPHEQRWFTREQITEVILAHELFHLIEPARVTHSANEAAAHEFAQRLTGLPFHPTRYEEMLWATFSA